MASLVVGSSSLGGSLSSLLLADDIMPGSQPSYEICRAIYLFHPLGQKIAESPVAMAQSLPREITVPDGPDADATKAFIQEWKRVESDKIIRNVATQARIYGIASLALLEDGVKPEDPLGASGLANLEIAFNVLDPLNTAGSLVLNQDPNALDYQKHRDIRVNGLRYHRSRTVTLMNEQPIYIAYTTSAFGFTGRSVYQRALYPLKSFIQTMLADDMVARKAGLIVASIKQAGALADRVAKAGLVSKRQVLKIGATDNVVSIGAEDKVESLDLRNLEEPLREARLHIVENIASAVPMPAIILKNETLAEGFGEGTEDAKQIADHIDGVRNWMQPLYHFMDMVVQRRAWNKDFFAAMQNKYPDQYGDMSYEEAFGRWVNSFTAKWPSLLREPESELVKVDDTRFKAAIGLAQIMLPEFDPTNKSIVFQWLQDIANSSKHLFEARLLLDMDALENYTPPQPVPLEEPTLRRPAADSSVSESQGGETKIEQFVRSNSGLINLVTRQTGS